MVLLARGPRLALAVVAQGCLLGACTGVASRQGDGAAPDLEAQDSAADRDAGAETSVSGGGDASSDVNPATPFAGSPEDYWAMSERLLRKRLEECLAVRADYTLGGRFGTRILPTELFVTALVEDRVGAFRGGLDSGRLVFDAAAAGACLSKTEQQSCYDFRREWALGTNCLEDPQIAGAIQTGGYCAREEECVSPGDTCVYRGNACPASACLARAHAGESCADRWCVEGTRCSLEVDPICVAAAAPPTEGQACDPLGCAAGLFCSNGRTCRPYAERIDCRANGDCPFLEVCLLENGVTSGICGPGRGAGEVCRLGPANEQDCSPTTDCRPRSDGVPVCTDVWVKAGELCRNTGSKGGIVCIEGFCDIRNATTQEGVCVPLLGPGEMCFLNNCAAGLDCTTNGCQPVVARCSSSSCPAGLYCANNGQCAPVTPPGGQCVPNGDACGPGSACIDGICRLCP
jgi:hypothetical protein